MHRIAASRSLKSALSFNKVARQLKEISMSRLAHKKACIHTCLMLLAMCKCANCKSSTSKTCDVKRKIGVRSICMYVGNLLPIMPAATSGTAPAWPHLQSSLGYSASCSFLRLGSDGENMGYCLPSRQIVKLSMEVATFPSCLTCQACCIGWSDRICVSA